MPLQRRLIVRWLIPLILVTFFLSGCASSPFLATDNSYSIVTVASDKTTTTSPIQLPWNANTAILRKLLFEASFTISDLHTIVAVNKDQNSDPSVYLVSAFPQSKQLALTIDDSSVTMDVQSIQVEVQGPDPGRVILNQSWVLQGIPDPNLTPAYLDFLDMLQNHQDGKPSN